MGNCILTGQSYPKVIGTAKAYNVTNLEFDANQCYKRGYVASVNVQCHTTDGSGIPSDYSDFITLPWKPISGTFILGACWTTNEDTIKYITLRLTGNGRIRLDRTVSADGHTNLLFSGNYLCKE